MGAKSAYTQWYAPDRGVPLFYAPWWLDQVCGPDQWDVAWLEGPNGRGMACWPYRLPRWGLLTPPPLSPGLGPWWGPPHPDGSIASGHAWAFRWLPQLAAQLPPHWYLRCKCPPGFGNGLPFHWQGFQQTTHFSFSLSLGADAGRVWQHFSSNLRNELRSAARELMVTPAQDEHWPLLLRWLEAKAVYLEWDVNRYLALDAAVQERGQRWWWLVSDRQGHPQALAYVVADVTTAYLLLLAGSPGRKHRGAMALAIWESIQVAWPSVANFDFAGSMLPRVAPRFAEFGGALRPYAVLERWAHPALAAAAVWYRQRGQPQGRRILPH